MEGLPLCMEGSLRLILRSLVALAIAHQVGAQTPPRPATDGPCKTLPLNQLVKDALERNLTLASARATTHSTEMAVDSARSTFDPQLALSPSYARADQSVLSTQQMITGTQPTTSYAASVNGQTPISTSYSFSFQSDRVSNTNPSLLAVGVQTPSVNNTMSFAVSQPLLKGFGSTYAHAPVDLAQYTADSAQARLRRTADQTIADVETAYWTLGFAEANERLSRDSLTRAQELQTRNEKMLDLKLISELDALTARRGYQQRLTSLTDATRRRRDAAENLLFLVYGRAAAEHLPERDAICTEPPPSDTAPTPPPAELEKLALERRPDFQAARLDLSQSQLQTRVNKNALLPDVRVTGTYSANVLGTDGVRLFNTSRLGDLEQNGWKLGFSVSYPIGNRGARAAYQKARYDAEAQDVSVASFENLVRNQARSSARGIDTNRERLQQAQRSFDYAKQQYEAGQKQLQLGLLDSFRLLQMEEEVSNAESVLEQTRYDFALSMTDFGLATGTIAGRYGVEAPK
jgi:outer membrane protein TolC